MFRRCFGAAEAGKAHSSETVVACTAQQLTSPRKSSTLEQSNDVLRTVIKSGLEPLPSSMRPLRVIPSDICIIAQDGDHLLDDATPEEVTATFGGRDSKEAVKAVKPVRSDSPQSASIDVLRCSFDLAMSSKVIHEEMRSRRASSIVFAEPADLVADVCDLVWLGQGSQGVVFEGRWHCASVAVKYSVVDKLDAQAYELIFSKMLCHPHVVQTFQTKVAVLDAVTITSRKTTATGLCSNHNSGSQLGRSLVPSHSRGRYSTSTAESSVCGVPSAHLLTTGGVSASSGGGRASSDDELVRSASFNSDDGFGDPQSTSKSALADVRDMLRTIGARPGQYITQMIMERCDLGSLLTAVRKNVFVPTSKWGPKAALRALLRTAGEIAQGMYHLHTCEVLHADLKPGNVLLISSRKDRRGFVAKVSDFGTAQYCQHSDDHVSDAPWGTIVYQAPERMLLNQLSKASDVYSFGVLLWEMYTGKRPHEGMTVPLLVVRCANGTLSLPWPPESDPSLATLASECMSYDPLKRPTFEEIQKRLVKMEVKIRNESCNARSSNASANEFSGSSVCASSHAGGYGSGLTSRLSTDSRDPHGDEKTNSQLARNRALIERRISWRKSFEGRGELPIPLPPMPTLAAAAANPVIGAGHGGSMPRMSARAGSSSGNGPPPSASAAVAIAAGKRPSLQLDSRGQVVPSAMAAVGASNLLQQQLGTINHNRMFQGPHGSSHTHQNPPPHHRPQHSQQQQQQQPVQQHQHHQLQTLQAQLTAHHARDRDRNNGGAPPCRSATSNGFQGSLVHSALGSSNRALQHQMSMPGNIARTHAGRSSSSSQTELFTGVGGGAGGGGNKHAQLFQPRASSTHTGMVMPPLGSGRGPSQNGGGNMNGHARMHHLSHRPPSKRGAMAEAADAAAAVAAANVLSEAKDEADSMVKTTTH